MNRLLPFLLILMGGCASLQQKPKIYKTSFIPGLAKDGGTLVMHEANRAKIDEVCLTDSVCIEGEDCFGTMDNGTKINYANKDRIMGCNSPGEIWYLYGKACIVPHELCHESGIPAEICEKEYSYSDYCK